MPISAPVPAPRTAASAYRADLAARPGSHSFGDGDGAWILVASLLQRAGAPGARVKAESVASALVGAERIAAGFPLDPEPDDAGRTALRLVAEDAEEAGALRTADTILAAMLAGDTLPPVIRGRVLAHQGRVAWKLGDLDRAAATYRAVGRMGRDLQLPELRVRAIIGRAALAQLRGNFPEMRRLSRLATRAARHFGFTRLEATARMGLMVVDARARDFDAALQHGWHIWQGVRGDQRAEVSVLVNAAQVLLDAGEAQAAASTFAALLVRRPQPAAMLGALGGLALASAATGDAARVQWVREQLDGIEGAPPYPLCLALSECAEALRRIGVGRDAARVAERAAALASAHGYHELAFRTEEAARQPAPAASPSTTRPALRPAAARAARHFDDLRPSRLPARLELAGAGG